MGEGFVLVTFDPTQTGVPKLDTPFVQENKLDPGAGRQIAIPWYQFLVNIWNRTGGGTPIPPVFVQVGVIQAFGGDVAPPEYLMCDGAFYDPAALPGLFAVIGYKFGQNGALFAVPNLIDKFPTGAGGALAPNVGDTGGSLSVILTQAMLPNVSMVVNDPGHTHTQASHNHTQNSHNHTQVSHNHTQNGHDHLNVFDNSAAGNSLTSSRSILRASSGGANPYDLRGAGLTDVPNVGQTSTTVAANIATTAANNPVVAVNNATTALNDPATTGIGVTTGGSGAAVPIVPPLLGVNWIIKA